jgi:hypothetical protein
MSRTTFFSADAEKLGVTPGQIQKWDETGLVKPAEKRARRRIYDRDTFRRLLLTRDLCAAGLSHKAKVVLPAVTLPERDCWVVTDGAEFNAVATEPLGALRVAVESKRKVAIVPVPLDSTGGAE